MPLAPIPTSQVREEQSRTFWYFLSQFDSQHCQNYVLIQLGQGRHKIPRRGPGTVEMLISGKPTLRLIQVTRYSHVSPTGGHWALWHCTQDYRHHGPHTRLSAPTAPSISWVCNLAAQGLPTIHWGVGLTYRAAWNIPYVHNPAHHQSRRWRKKQNDY